MNAVQVCTCHPGCRCGGDRRKLPVGSPTLMSPSSATGSPSDPVRRQLSASASVADKADLVFHPNSNGSGHRAGTHYRTPRATTPLPCSPTRYCHCHSRRSSKNGFACTPDFQMPSHSCADPTMPRSSTLVTGTGQPSKVPRRSPRGQGIPWRSHGRSTGGGSKQC